MTWTVSGPYVNETVNSHFSISYLSVEVACEKFGDFSETMNGKGLPSITIIHINLNKYFYLNKSFLRNIFILKKNNWLILKFKCDFLKKKS